MRQTMRGTGLAIIDGKQTREERIATLQKVTDQKAVPLNLSTLFGSMDYCECDDCLSVYSPASYFVELLQFLRNNNLDPKNPNTEQKGHRRYAAGKALPPPAGSRLPGTDLRKHLYGPALYRPGQRGHGKFCGPPGRLPQGPE